MTTTIDRKGIGTIISTLRLQVPRHQRSFEWGNDLNKSALLYTAIGSPEHEYWAGIDQITRDRLRTLALFGLEQYKPMLLAALVHFEQKDVEEIVRLLEAWNVRLVIVGGLGGGVMEGKYAELARGIRSGDIKNVKALTQAASIFVPGDSEFKAQFSVATVSKVPLARYYLHALERGIAKKAAEYIPNPSLTLEHVLPEKPGENYPQFSSDARKLYTRRLGNLALLTHKTNSDLKSSSFTAKQAEYEKSTLKLTADLANLPDWTPEQIDKRQKAMADQAVLIWPMK